MASKEIKLSKREENEMLWDDLYNFTMNNKTFIIGCMPVNSRLLRVTGLRKHTYYAMSVTQKGYKVYRKTHDLKEAEMSLSLRMSLENWDKELRVLSKRNKKSNVQNRSVRRNNRRSKKERTHDPIMKIVYSIDTKPKDNDTEEIYNAKMALSSVRPKDLEVQLLPDKHGNWEW